MQPKPNDFWYTPPEIISKVEGVLGEDYFDPCPIDPEFDGLEEKWIGNCFINPPYSKDLRRAFIRKAEREWDGRSQYLWLLNYGCSQDLTDVKNLSTMIGLPEKRIRFIAGHPDLKESSPRYNSVFLLWGPHYGFRENFKEIGMVANVV